MMLEASYLIIQINIKNLFRVDTVTQLIEEKMSDKEIICKVF